MDNDNTAVENTPAILGSPETEKSETANPVIPETEENESARRHIRSPFIKRKGGLIMMMLFAVIGTVLGALLYRGAVYRADSSFLEMFLGGALPGIALLLAEYICGYFALGGLILWVIPLMGGLSAGINLSIALQYVKVSTDFLFALPIVLGTVTAVTFGADEARNFSKQILRIISGRKNSIVMTDYAAGNYTLRFGVFLTILLVGAIADAVIRLNNV